MTSDTTDFSSLCAICHREIRAVGEEVYDSTEKTTKVSCNRSAPEGLESRLDCSYYLYKIEQMSTVLREGVNTFVSENPEYISGKDKLSSEMKLRLKKPLWIVLAVPAILMIIIGMIRGWDVMRIILTAPLVSGLFLLIPGWILIGIQRDSIRREFKIRLADFQGQNQQVLSDTRSINEKERLEFQRQLDELRHDASLIREAAVKEAQAHEEERSRISTEWEQLLYRGILEKDRFRKDGLLRIRGYKLLQLIDWRQFEVVLSHILKYQGWNAKTTSNGADAGVDVRGTQGSRRLILQAKHFKSGGNVGRPDLQKLMGVAQTNHATDVILASSSGFTRQAIAEEKQAYNLGYKFQLWDGKKLERTIDSMSSDSYGEMIEALRADLTQIIGKQ